MNRQLLSQALPAAQRAGIPVLLDPKVHHADYYRPITLITPNHREAELLTGMSIDNDSDLEAAGSKLLERFECPYALITRGEEGMSLFSKTGSHHLPTFAREVFDVTGAGDTVIATLALALTAGAEMEEVRNPGQSRRRTRRRQGRYRNRQPSGTARGLRLPQCAFFKLVRRCSLVAAKPTLSS